MDASFPQQWCVLLPGPGQGPLPRTYRSAYGVRAGRAGRTYLVTTIPGGLRRCRAGHLAHPGPRL